MKQETRWILTGPVLSVFSGHMRLLPAVSMIGYKKKRHDFYLFTLPVTFIFYSSCPFQIISVSMHCLGPCFSADAATKSGNEASDPVQYSPHLQSTPQPEELCLQHWRGCRAAYVSV